MKRLLLFYEGWWFSSFLFVVTYYFVSQVAFHFQSILSAFNINRVFSNHILTL